MKKFLSQVLLLLCAGVSALEIVKDSTPLAEIVVDAKAHSAVKFAAEDLRHWVKEITGGELPLVNAPSGSKKIRVFIGKNFAEKSFAADLAALAGTDGFAIRPKGNDLYLFGPEHRSNAYAVASLLENNTDIIWARPDERFGCVFTKSPTLDLKKCDFLDKPAFPLHGWNVVAIRRDFPTAKWVLRNRGNYADQAEPKGQDGLLGFLNRSGGHIYWWMAHPDKYFKTHPEYYGFSKAGGKREPETLCLTAPGLIELAVENLSARIEAMKVRPEELHIGFRDSWNMCQCEACTAPIRLPDGSTLECKSLNPQADCKYYSTRYWLFVGEIAQRLKKKYPEMDFSGSGYMYTAEPPACDFPEYMFVDFCPIGGVDPRYPILSPKQDRIWCRRLTEWGKRFPGRVYYYEYYCSYDSGYASVGGTGSLKDKIVRDLRDMKEKLKGPGVISELTPDSERKFSNHTMKSEWDANTAFRWIVARLMWNPYQDFDALEKHFLDRACREAAPAMKKFYDLYYRAWSDPGRAAKGWSIFTSKYANDCYAALCEAEKLAVHPNSKTMIERMKNQWLVAKKHAGVNTVPRMDRQEKFMEFDATCYETSLIRDDFLLPPYFTSGKALPPRHATELRLLTDGEFLYFRLHAKNPAAFFRKNAKGKPFGDFLYLSVRGGARGVPREFLIDGDGGWFDSAAGKGSRAVKHAFLKDGDGYKCLIAVPLAELGVKDGDPKTFPSMAVIRRAYDGKTEEISTLKGIHPGYVKEKISF